MSKKKTTKRERRVNIPWETAKLYEKAKGRLLLGTSDNVNDYMTLSLDTFDEMYPLFAELDDDAKQAFILGIKKDFLSVMMLSVAVQAQYVGQYRRRKPDKTEDELDVFDSAGILGYYAALKSEGLIVDDK